MLKPDDYEHLTAEDWAKIAAKLLNLKDGEQIILTTSDAHKGGVTSCAHQVENIVFGFAQHASVFVQNGDDQEYESPAALMKAVEELKIRYPKIPPNEILQKKAEEILHEKVKEDIAELERLIREQPNRKIVKIIGNHENFETFRNELQRLEKTYPNFQWSPEMEIIPIPGAKKDKKGDTLLAVHGDLQMDDLWFVEEGGSDKERKLYKHAEMAAKAVGIATHYWVPSAQKQEKFQWAVDWWRKPNATAKTLYAELMFRAECGAGLEILKENLENAKQKLKVLAETENRLEGRRDKFVEFNDELQAEKNMSAADKAHKEEVYDKAISTIDEQLEQLAIIRRQIEEISHKSDIHIKGMQNVITKVLHYKTPGNNTSKLFTPEVLEGVTHINYGHTHVSNKGTKLKGIKDEVIISNNASMTEAIMQAPLDDKGQPRKIKKGEEIITDLRNLGALLYVTENGKIKEVLKLGELIAENIKTVTALVEKVPKPKIGIDTSVTVGRIKPEDIGKRENTQGHDQRKTAR